ncbi:MAG: ROK family transcriptional regulator [Firmicutes bacterium]|jgi:predicted NBD/HSP70 family sugar kinase|nr:ROK family transcriptional regulator [Bacillota bacterium]
MGIVTGKPALIKKINRSIVIKLIIKHKEISRSEISKITKLSLPSVMRIIDSLIDEGLVIEIGKGDSSGGRKPSLLSMNNNAMYIIGVEIAINSRIILTDLSGKVLDSEEFDNSNISTPLGVLTKIKECIDSIISRNKDYEGLISGIGIGTPGENYKYNDSIEMAIIKGWEELNVLSWFENHFDYPVFVENVARTRTLSELWFGEGQSIKNFIYLFIDRGVGCGIVNNGSVYEGYNGVAGELGHTIIQLDGRKCYCGNKGCLEMYVSAGAILNQLKENNNYYKDYNFEKLIENQSDEEIGSIIEKSAKIMGIATANLINLYNPEAVILGGIVAKSFEEFSKILSDTLNENIFNKNALNTRILSSKLDYEKTGLGSVALVINNIFKSVEL